MPKIQQRSVLFLRVLIILYIILTGVMAFLNYAVAPNANKETADLIHFIWAMFENPFKSLLIVIGTIVTLIQIPKTKVESRKNRLPILLGFVCSAAVIHLILPLIFNNWEFYFVTMPAPWSTTGLQLINGSSTLAEAIIMRIGMSGQSIMIAVFLIYAVGILIATAFGGRRIQCSQLCLFNGFMAEAMAPALPLIGKQKTPSKRFKTSVKIFRWVYFSAGILFSAFWVTTIIKPDFWLENVAGNIYTLESQKYLYIDLAAMLFFWILWGPRNYCLYCPAGTTCGLIGTGIAGQQIDTNLTSCKACSLCKKVCPAGLNPMDTAVNGTPYRSTQCLGCGRCTEICPTKTLLLSTRLQRMFKKSRK